MFILVILFFSHLKIFNVGQLLDHRLVILVKQRSNGFPPACFVDLFFANSDYHSYHTRNVDKLVYQKRNIVRSAHVFRHVAITLWNCLPDSIRGSRSVSVFISQVIKFLLC